MEAEERFDLVVLAADNSIEAGVAALFDRNDSMRTRQIRWKTLVHRDRDPGCFHTGPALLANYQFQADYALLIFDHDGCGQEHLSREALEIDAERRMVQRGWAERCAVIVLDPELETWVWSDSSEVDEVLGWKGRQPALRDWLRENGLWKEGALKPADPKEAFKRALREVGATPSSALFAKLSEKVSFRRCQDPAFQKLKTVLQRWFPQR